MKSQVLIAFVLSASVLFAQSKPAKTLKVLTEAQIDPARLLPPPPANGSDVQVRELAEVRRLVQTRTAERFAQANWDAAHENPTAFAATLGPNFDLAKLPATAKLLDIVTNDQQVAVSAAKVYFHRQLPLAAANVTDDSYRNWTCDAKPRKPAELGLRSYPSAHATMGYSVGIILAALIPEKSQAILLRAVDFAHSREVCGDHYHSDVEASHALGNALGIMFLSSPALKTQIEDARAELRAAHLTAQ